MAESFTSYSVDNDKRFRDALKKAAEVVTDFTVPFGLILQDFYRSEKAIFGLQGPGQYPDFKSGGPESKYAKLKEKDVGFKYPLLVRSGALAASMLSNTAAGSVGEITSGSLTIGTTIDYGAYHQSDAARKKIPLRKFLFIGPEAPQFATSDQQGRSERWMAIINDAAVRAIRVAGVTP